MHHISGLQDLLLLEQEESMRSSSLSQTGDLPATGHCSLVTVCQRSEILKMDGAPKFVHESFEKLLLIKEILESDEMPSLALELTALAACKEDTNPAICGTTLRCGQRLLAIRDLRRYAERYLCLKIRGPQSPKALCTILQGEYNIFSS